MDPTIEQLQAEVCALRVLVTRLLIADAKASSMTPEEWVDYIKFRSAHILNKTVPAKTVEQAKVKAGASPFMIQILRDSAFLSHDQNA
jgi:hypothetical protein